MRSDIIETPSSPATPGTLALPSLSRAEGAADVLEMDVVTRRTWCRLHLYELAHLAGGKRRAALTVLALAERRRHIGVADTGEITVLDPRPAGAHPLDALVAANGGGHHDAGAFGFMLSDVEMSAIEERLIAMNLTRSTAMRVVLALAAFVAVVCALYVVLGTSAMLFGHVAAVLTFFVSRRTSMGREALAYARHSSPAIELGVFALSGPIADRFKLALKKPADGGSGCGGGCGGCGGCGG